MSNFLNETVYYSPQKYFDELIRSIDEAQSQILFESYIFDLDSIGNLVIEALQKAAQKNVLVYLSVDQVGSWHHTKQIKLWAKKNKIRLKIFNSRWNRLNQRNHRKMIIIDQTQIFVGSLNVTRNHLEWKDYGYSSSLSTSEYHQLAKSFFKARSTWFVVREALGIAKLRWLRKLRRLNKKKSSRFILNDSVLKRIRLNQFLKSQIRLSQKQVLLSSPYFLPRSFLLRSLLKAAKRGVEVKIIIPQKTDVWFVRLATRSLVRKLIRKNIAVYEYQKKVWHAKSLLFDDTLLIGSHNWNHRSFLHDLEILVTIKNDQLISEFKAEFKKDLIQCRELSSQVLVDDPIYIKILGNFFFLFRYWL